MATVVRDVIICSSRYMLSVRWLWVQQLQALLFKMAQYSEFKDGSEVADTLEMITA